MKQKYYTELEQIFGNYMKSKEELFTDYFLSDSKAQEIKYDIMRVINYAQEDAYKQGVLDLLENSDGLDLTYQAEKLLNKE